MNRATRGQLSSATLIPTDRSVSSDNDSPQDSKTTAALPRRKYRTKHMKMYPELYRSDVSINPSYTGLKNLPYYVVCRRRASELKKQITRQLNREIMHIVMIQNFALASVRIDRILSVGFSLDSTPIPDFATDKERRRINQLVAER